MLHVSCPANKHSTEVINICCFLWCTIGNMCYYYNTYMLTCISECTCPSIESGSPLALGKFPSKRSSIFLIDVVCF